MIGRFSFWRTCRLAAVLFTAGALGSVFACAPTAQAAQYLVTDLGMPGGTVGIDELGINADELGINASGQVTGESEMPSVAFYQAFLWTPLPPR